jgi:hypothetical protein
MKYVTFIFIFCFVFFFKSHSQGVVNNYQFGYYTSERGLLDFPNNTPNVNLDSNILIKMHYTYTNISDTSGNLLFYTNGVVIIDRMHDTMPNGKGLNPCQYTTQAQYDGLSISQGDLVLPDPGNINQYFLIHQSIGNYPNDYTNDKIYYSIINILLNNGRGNIIQKNSIFFQDTLWAIGITACKHANGRDWWVIANKAYQPVYFVFLLTPNGISHNSTQTIGTRWDIGQTAFSNNGENFGVREGGTNFQIFDFDRCTGIFSNARIILTNDSNWGIGFCFSPNSKLAYGASAHYLYQVNLDSVNLLNSLDTIAKWDSTYDPVFGPPLEAGFEFMQIGPDGKIYMTTTGATHYMHCIDYPDSVGIDCSMQQHALTLPTYNGNSMPNFVNYFLGPVVGSICDSLGLGIPENALHNFKFIIEPNPDTDKTLHCKYMLPQNKPGILEVMDLEGRIILKEPLPEWSIEQHIKLNITAGVYAVRITSNKQQAVQKLIVQ